MSKNTKKKPIPRSLKLDMLMYRTNKLAALLIYLALIFMIVAFSTIYGYLTVVDYRVGIDIIANIICLLVLFLAAEKCKVYDLTWGLICFPLAAILLLKGFLVPTMLFNAKVSATDNTRILDGLRYAINVVFTIGSAAAVIGAGVITIIRASLLSEARKNDRILGGKHSWRA